MITSKKELKFYISEDRKRQPIERPFLSALTFSESWSVRSYLTILRHYEFHLNSLNALRQKCCCRTVGGGNSSTVSQRCSRILLYAMEA